MGKLADYMTHHEEITEMKIVDEKGEVSFQKVEAHNDESIRIGDSIISKDDESLNVLDYKDYIVSIDDMQFGTKDKDEVKDKMMNVYEKLKNIKFSDTRTEKFKIKNEREKDQDGNYIIYKDKREISFEKEMKFPKDSNGKDIKIRGAHGEYQKQWTGQYILTKEYQRKEENLDGAFFSLHLNEDTHPHVHCWIPTTAKMGYKYEAFRSAVREVLSNEGLIIQEDNVFFDKNELKIEKNNEALNNYRTARQVLSSYSYALEEYQSLKGEKKLDFQGKTFTKDIVKARRHTIDMNATEHRTEVSTTKKYQSGEQKGQYKEYMVYSFSKLLKDYTSYKAGSQDFINQLISRHNALTSYSKKDITKYTSEIEKRAIEIYQNQGIDGIIQLLKDCIFDKEKVPCIIKDLWRELAFSESLLKRAVAEQMTEIYQSRATKQTDIDYERLEKASAKINMIYQKYESLDIYEKILVRFEELLKTEMVKESNIINTLKDEFNLETLYIDKTDKTLLRFGTKDYEKVSIKQLLGDKTTVYQVIAENKNKKQIESFASEMEVAVAETTNSVGGMVARETINEIMKDKPFFYLVPLHQAIATDKSHEEKLDINIKNLCSVREQSIKSIKREIQFKYVDKIAVLEPKRFSSIIISSIVSACMNVFSFSLSFAKDFAEKIMQKAEIKSERIALGNKQLKELTHKKAEITDINELKEKLNTAYKIQEYNTKNKDEIGDGFPDL